MSSRACNGVARFELALGAGLNCDGIPSTRAGWIPRSGNHARALTETMSRPEPTLRGKISEHQRENASRRPRRLGMGISYPRKSGRA